MSIDLDELIRLAKRGDGVAAEKVIAALEACLLTKFMQERALDAAEEKP